MINTHLLANFDRDWSRCNRFAVEQEDELGELADAVAAEDAAVPLVVVGDLNVPTEAWLLDDFLGRTGLRDAFEGRSERTGRPAPRHGSRTTSTTSWCAGPWTSPPSFASRSRWSWPAAAGCRCRTISASPPPCGSADAGRAGCTCRRALA